MTRRLAVLGIVLSVACIATANETPKDKQTVNPAKVLEKALQAAGGQSAFSQLGTVKVSVAEEETTSGGTTKKGSFGLFFNAAGLRQARLEMGANVVIGQDGSDYWATIHGKIDRRKQTPAMAKGTLNMKLFPLLLPFSLSIPGVHLGAVKEETWQGQQIWAMTVTFQKNFFSSPVMNVPWVVAVDRSSGKILFAEYRPIKDFVKVGAEAVRYDFLRWERVGQALLPSSVVMEGLAPASDRATGHTSTIRLQWTSHLPHDMSRFMNPEKIEALDSGDVPGIN